MNKNLKRFAAFAGAWLFCMSQCVLVFFAGGYQWGTEDAGALISTSVFLASFAAAMALAIAEDK